MDRPKASTRASPHGTNPFDHDLILGSAGNRLARLLGGIAKHAIVPILLSVHSAAGSRASKFAAFGSRRVTRVNVDGLDYRRQAR